METTETPKQERYLISALVESADNLTHLTGSLEAVGASVIKSEALGSRRLSFPVAKKTELELISAFFMAEPKTAYSLERSLQRDSLIKRFLITKWAVDPNAAPRSRAKKKVETAA